MKRVLAVVLALGFLSASLTACNPFGSQSDTAPSKVQKKFGE